MHIVPPPASTHWVNALHVPGAGAERRGLPPPPLPPKMSAHPSVGLGAPPGMSVHATVHLTAAACPHGSPDVTGVGLQSASGWQSTGMSPAVTHHHRPNRPSPLTRALGRGLGRPPLAPKHQTLAAAAVVVLGPHAVASFGLGVRIPIRRRSAPGSHPLPGSG